MTMRKNKKIIKQAEEMVMNNERKDENFFDNDKKRGKEDGS